MGCQIPKGLAFQPRFGMAVPASIEAKIARAEARTWQDVEAVLAPFKEQLQGIASDEESLKIHFPPRKLFFRAINGLARLARLPDAARLALSPDTMQGDEAARLLSKAASERLALLADLIIAFDKSYQEEKTRDRPQRGYPVQIEAIWDKGARLFHEMVREKTFRLTAHLLPDEAETLLQSFRERKEMVPECVAVPVDYRTRYRAPFLKPKLKAGPNKKRHLSPPLD